METQNSKSIISNSDKTEISKDVQIQKLERKIYNIPAIFYLFGFLNIAGGLFEFFSGDTLHLYALLYIIPGLSFCIFTFLIRKYKQPSSATGLFLTAVLQTITIQIYYYLDVGNLIPGFGILIIYVWPMWYSYASINTLKKIKELKSSEDTISIPHE
jgi:hypothetical protein